MTTSIQAKAMARRLRADLLSRGLDLRHSEALELVARQLGHRDWNTFAAGVAGAGDGDATTDELGPDDGLALGHVVPVLRIFDRAKAFEFYTGYLGFDRDWEHQAGEHLPLYAQVSRGSARLHLSEHHGDASPGAAVVVPVTDITELHTELTRHDHPAAAPGIVDEEWGRTLTVLDPFSNRITFRQPNSAADDEPSGHPARAAAPIRVDLEVAAAPDTAFEVFAIRMGEWWDPVYTPDATTFTGIEIEPRLGGAVTMRHGDDGYRWGTVTGWEPGRRYAQSFTLAHDPEYPSSLTVRFEPDGSGCKVRFEHGGWTAGNVAARQRFGDWPHLLARFAELAQSTELE
jgi:hypothetical protein